MKVRYIIILFVILILSILAVVFFNYSRPANNNTPNKQEVKITSNSLLINKDKEIYVVPESTKQLSVRTPGAATELYIANKKENTKKLLYSSDIPMVVTSLDDTKKTFNTKNGTIFIAYTFSELKMEDSFKKNNETGIVFMTDNSGNTEKIYTTENTFDSASIENNQLVIYEKIYMDSMNVYPSYYKPYIRVKKALKNNSFVEVERKEIDPTIWIILFPHYDLKST